MRIPLAFRAHSNDGALEIADSNSLLTACSRLAGGETTYAGELMEVIVYDAHGAMKTHHRGISYRTRLHKLGASETDRIVLWDSASSNIMSCKRDVLSASVFLHVDPPPGDVPVEPNKYVLGTFPMPHGHTLDADMHTALRDSIDRGMVQRALPKAEHPAVHGDAR